MTIIDRLRSERPGGASGCPMTNAEVLCLAKDRVLAASDAELASALCAGELSALDEVFRRHATKVADAVRRAAGGYYVDDVVQEVFLSLWRAPERFQANRGSLAAYLVMMTRTKAIDAVRSNQAWRRRHLRHDDQRTPSAEVEDVVMAGVSADDLGAALRALPMAERVAIELAYFGGYTYREVAAQLNEPEGTIKSRIRSGLRRLEVALRGLDAAEIE